MKKKIKDISSNLDLISKSNTEKEKIEVDEIKDIANEIKKKRKVIIIENKEPETKPKHELITKQSEPIVELENVTQNKYFNFDGVSYLYGNEYIMIFSNKTKRKLLLNDRSVSLFKSKILIGIE